MALYSSIAEAANYYHKVLHLGYYSSPRSASNIFLRAKSSWKEHYTRNKVSINDFFSKCDQFCRKLRIWSHLLKKSLIENFIFCAVVKKENWYLQNFQKNTVLGKMNLFKNPISYIQLCNKKNNRKLLVFYFIIRSIHYGQLEKF